MICDGSVPHVLLRVDKLMLGVRGPATNIGYYVWISRGRRSGFGWLRPLDHGSGTQMVHRSFYAAVMAGVLGCLCCRHAQQPTVLQLWVQVAHAVLAVTNWVVSVCQAAPFVLSVVCGCVGCMHTVCASECTVVCCYKDLVAWH
jgi:hypothetical protein